MLSKITNNDWPDTVRIGDGYYTKEAPEPSRRNLEFLADQFNALLDLIYSKESECPCGSKREYKECCGEI